MTGKTKFRKWNEGIAQDHGCTLTHKGAKWVVRKNGKVIYESNSLLGIDSFFNEMAKKRK